MKKIFTILLILTLALSSYALDFVLNPNIGYANTYLVSKNERYAGITINYNTASFGMHLGSIAQNGFTFLFNSGFILNGKFSVYQDGKLQSSTKAVKSGIWYIQAIFGYTFRLLEDKLHVTIGVGPEGSVGMGYTWGFSAGGTIYSSVDYYFLDWIGITCSIHDSICIGRITEVPGLYNNFQFSIGPKFKI